MATRKKVGAALAQLGAAKGSSTGNRRQPHRVVDSGPAKPKHRIYGLRPALVPACTPIVFFTPTLGPGFPVPGFLNGPADTREARVCI